METSMKLCFSLFMNMNGLSYIFDTLVHEKRVFSHNLSALKHVVIHITHSV